ncbi:MAG: SDR family oxidoreductase [Ilumatobacter sp.]|uniref:SDR family NAD(P)-dependent oxidoreductase n=1 Tax=Ilumatobacter sp. TaxID=1967498 RepID=UPI003298B164
MSGAERVAIVTGGASGIGRACVERFVEQGYGVVAVDRSVDAFAWLGDDILGDVNDVHVVPLAGDVTDRGTNDHAVAVAVDRFGRLDVAVFNAGVSMGGDLIDLPIEEFDRAMDVNVRAVALGIRAVTPTLREQGEGGRIVVTASTSGIGADPRMWAYNTSKAAVINLARAAAIDLGADGITVNAVCPGPTETAMTSGLAAMPDVHDELRRRIPLQRWGRPEEVAAMIAFVSSPEASFVNGAVIPVDGGITANTGQFSPGSRG